jgi:NADPH:quinone reductase
MVGGEYIPRDIEALAADGRVTCIATPAGSATTVEIGKLIRKRAGIMGSALRARNNEQKAAIARELREKVWPLLPARDPVRPIIDSVFKLEDVSKAHARMESSQHIGKIVLET